MPEYQRDKRINSGGQGEVWLGHDEQGRQVAIKYLLLTGNEAQQEEDRRRFQREVTCQTSLDHPGVLPILGMNLSGTDPHFAMPVADGSQRELLPPGTGRPSLSESESLSMFIDILAAVGHAHDAGVIHRDLKPENILLIDGDPVISDFGLGRRLYSESTTLTMTNVGMGTLAYSAPEQFSNAKEADARADVFALGRIFYEMLTGSMAVAGIDLNAVPAKFRFIINKATQLDPSRRFASVDEIQRELALLGGEGEGLLAPVDRATSLIGLAANGDDSKVDDLARLILENAEDLQLFVQVIPQIPESILAVMAQREPENYHEVMRVFDEFASGSFGWDFTDKIAVFLMAAYRATDDIRVHALVIERLLVLGASHNRWFVRSRFVDAVRIALHEPGHAPLVSAALRGNPWAISFVREALSELSLPTSVQQALAA